MAISDITAKRLPDTGGGTKSTQAEGKDAGLSKGGGGRSGEVVPGPLVFRVGLSYVYSYACTYTYTLDHAHEECKYVSNNTLAHVYTYQTVPCLIISAYHSV